MLPKLLAALAAIFFILPALPSYGLDINTASYEEMLSLPGITKFQAYKIHEYREVFGYFRAPGELLRVEGITQADLDNWGRDLVIAVPETTVKPKVSLRVKDQNAGGVEGGDFQSIHLRVKNINNCWSGAVLAEIYPHYVNYAINGSKANYGSWSQHPRINKFYISWTPHKAIEKIYFGDYQAGFGEGVVMDISGRSKPQGLYPGDVPAMEYDAAKISNGVFMNAISYRSAKTFRGVAAVLDQNYLKETLFYSNQNNSYYGVYINNSAIRKPLEDYFLEQVSGADVTGYVLGETELGVTSYYSKRYAKGPDPWRYPPGEKDLLVYGAHVSTYLGRYNICGELGKVKDHGRAIFLESSTDLGNLNVSASYRDYGYDYYNPHSGSYSRHYPQSVFRNRDEKGVLAKAKWQALRALMLKGFFDQYSHQAQAYWSRSKGDYAVSFSHPETDREAGLESKFLASDAVILNLEARYKDNNIYCDSGSEKVNTTAKISYLPNEIIETSLKYYVRKYLKVTQDYIPYDYASAACSYQVTKVCALDGSLKYANIFVHQHLSGISEYSVGARCKINDNTKLRLSYTIMPPLAKNSKYEFEDEADLLPYTDEYYLDKFIAEVVFQW
jgi:hypothetical protein